MSLPLTTSPTEDPAIIRTLLQANLLSVFNERSTPARSAAIKNTYSPSVIWYEPDRVNHGHEELDTRAAEILAESPGLIFQVDGDMVVTQNLGVLNWKAGPVDDPEFVRGIDVILVEKGKIVALWTAITKVPGS